MPDAIVPAAVSSQLDQSGEERIHIANIVPGGVTRTPYTPPLEITTMYAAQFSNTLLYISADATAWPGTTVAPGLTAASEQLVDSYGGKIHFMNSNGGRVCHDSTGAAWANCTGLPGGTIIKSMFYIPANGPTPAKWWAVAESGTQIYSSTDGVAFSGSALNASSTSWQGSVARGQIAIVTGVSMGTRRTADGGATWATVSTGSVFLNKIVDSGTAFVGIGNSDTANILVSSDGTSWTGKTYPGQTGGVFKRNLAYAPGVGSGIGRFLLTLSNGATVYSDDDGQTWLAGASAGTAPTDSSPLDNAMVYAHGFFVMQGGGAGFSTVVTSPDGVSNFVTRLTTASTNELCSISPFRTGQ